MTTTNPSYQSSIVPAPRDSAPCPQPSPSPPSNSTPTPLPLSSSSSSALFLHNHRHDNNHNKNDSKNKSNKRSNNTTTTTNNSNNNTTTATTTTATTNNKSNNHQTNTTTIPNQIFHHVSRLITPSPFLLIAILLFLLSSPSPSHGRIWEIPTPPSLQACYNQVARADISTYVGSTFSWFCETAIKSSRESGPKKFDAQKTSYYDHLYRKSIEVIKTSAGARRVRAKRQAGHQRCLRREYRTLSDAERTRFHNAINALKSDTSVEPNKYDAIALLHTGMASFTAHGGPGFPGWHRIYTLMFESALREVDPSVCLPYWDSTLDSELDDPLESVVWGPRFFGNPQGPVVEGPFAGWVTPEGSQLMRTASADGELFRRDAIDEILTRGSHAEILTSEETDPRFDLEFHHAAVHVFCGGTMGQLDTSAFDPIFFIHHSYVDFVWETFRNGLRSRGIDPNIYPDVEDIDSRHHGASATGFGELTQADGYSDHLIESYEYEAVPRCSTLFPDCGSRYLTCYTDIGRCIPVHQGDTVIVHQPQQPPPQLHPRQQQPARPRQQQPHHPQPNATPTVHRQFPPNSARGPAHQTCSSAPKIPIQNSYCCDQSCDTNEWAYVPVKIVSVRPPNFRSFQSFPVRKGFVDTRNDIYSPSAYSKTNRYISRRLGNPKTFQRCQGDDSSSGQVFLSSKGINYDGYYKEATIVDKRMAVSISMGYIAVKRPTRGPRGVTQALLRAHDSCGRVCHPACRDPKTNQFGPCSGAVAISSDSPKMYGDTFDDAVLDVFDYDFNDDCPRFNTENFYVTFYCDYHNEFPYADRLNPNHNHNNNHHSPQRPQQPPIRPPQVVVRKTTPARGDSFSPRQDGCRLSALCTLSVPCVSEYRQCDRYNELQMCVGSCRTFAQCSYGRYFVRQCPFGQYFDDVIRECIAGICRKTAGGQRIISPGGQTTGNRGSGSGRLQYLSDDIGLGSNKPTNASPSGASPVGRSGGSGSYQEQMQERLRNSRRGDYDESSSGNRRSDPQRNQDYNNSHPSVAVPAIKTPTSSSSGRSYADRISGLIRNVGQRLGSRYQQ